MCGVCGIIWKQRRGRDDDAIRRMSRSMVHRGPDDEGYYTDGPVDLGHRRLSIIDLAGGHQPITTEDGRYTIIYNGEVYNYRRVRDDLIAVGHAFRTNSDTEVILRAYAEWGGECVHRLRGMFAFAIWDGVREELFLTRDRLGVKPLFYAETGQWFAFASEVKALLHVPGLPRDFDHEALHHLLVFNAVPTPMTLFRHIRALPPGHRATYRHGVWRMEPYWDVPFHVNPGMTEEDALAGLDELIRESVRLRLIAEVPLGAFLSGGVDSSVVVATMAQQVPNPVKTFSIGWGDEYADFNEVRHARAVAEKYGTDHHEHTVTLSDLLADLPRIIWFYDQPTPSAFQTYFVSKFTKEQGITVALSGLGGDEIAAGYRFFSSVAQVEARWRLRARLMPGPLRRALAARLCGRDGIAGRVGRMAAVAGMTPGGRWRGHRMLEGAEDIARGLHAPWLAERARAWDTGALVADIIDRAPTDAIVNRLIYHELRRFMLDDPLTDTDRCSMAHSLEVRVPLIDHEVVEFAGTIPPELKVKGGEAKYLLKRLAERYLPRELIYRPKMGFEFPMMHWVRGPLAPVFDAVLSPSAVGARGLFSPEAVLDWRRRVTEHPGRGEAALLWNLAVVELWCRLYLDADEPTCPTMSLDELLHQVPRVHLEPELVPTTS